MLFGSCFGFAESNIVKAKTKKQYIENDTYFKTSRMNSLTAKMKKEEKPWGVSFHLLSAADISKEHNDRVYNQTLSLGAGYKWSDSYSIGLSSGVSYYAQDNNIPKEEGNPKWDDISVGLTQSLGEFQKVKFSQVLSTFAPTSYDSQYEGIKSGLSYGLSASHPIYFLNVGHNLSANYTLNSFEYSPTTGRRNSPWSNSYTLSVGLPYKINKQVSIGISENMSSRSSFDNDYFLVTSTLVYAGISIGKIKISANYLVGSYDENDNLRYFYVNDWQQKVSLGLSYEI